MTVKPRPPAGPRDWLTPKQAADYSKCSVRTIRKRIAEGVLPAYIPAGSRTLRIDRADLDRMIAGGGRVPSAASRARQDDGDAALRVRLRRPPGPRRTR